MKTAYIVMQRDENGNYPLCVFISREKAELFLKEHGSYIEECEMFYE